MSHMVSPPEDFCLTLNAIPSPRPQPEAVSNSVFSTVLTTDLGKHEKWGAESEDQGNTWVVSFDPFRVSVLKLGEGLHNFWILVPLSPRLPRSRKSTCACRIHLPCSMRPNFSYGALCSLVASLSSSILSIFSFYKDRVSNFSVFRLGHLYYLPACQFSGKEPVFSKSF